ncbi:ACP S-malonyltransferase, partial [Cyclobacteriaceae bacterium]|nr:ACP S-malonyltransferase [Cyclobacteriaceae bacterium]
AKRALLLPVSGAFHSPLMEPARTELAEAIAATEFKAPRCPIYQNVDARGNTDVLEIKSNLMAQLTSPVKWTQCVEQMIKDGATSFYESGPGNVLQGLIKKVNREMQVNSF